MQIEQTWVLQSVLNFSSLLPNVVLYNREPGVVDFSFNNSILASKVSTSSSTVILALCLIADDGLRLTSSGSAFGGPSS
jgi:hypothetical protein